MGVLQVDILTQREEARMRTSPELTPDTSVLAGRVIAAADWINSQPYLQHFCLGCLGFGVAGAAVLTASSMLNHIVDAVVVCEAQANLQTSKLSEMLSPTLLIANAVNRRLDESVFRNLKCEKCLEILPGAAALDTGQALETVIGLTREWFMEHLARAEALRAAGLRL
jgi:hypothetical protein